MTKNKIMLTYKYTNIYTYMTKNKNNITKLYSYNYKNNITKLYSYYYMYSNTNNSTFTLS